MSHAPTLEAQFAELTDPRSDHTQRHMLIDIVIVAIVAVICGADGWANTEEFGHAREAWLRRFLELPEGIPSHGTLGRIFARLDSEEFQRCFMNWGKAIHSLTAGQVIAVDGKCLRGTQDGYLGKQAISMVSAWATADHLVLGQVKVDDKSNEISAVPELLAMLDLHGCIVSVDGLNCQRKTATQIVEQGGDYLLASKTTTRICMRTCVTCSLGHARASSSRWCTMSTQKSAKGTGASRHAAVLHSLTPNAWQC